jgi:hypothetical protein
MPACQGDHAWRVATTSRCKLRKGICGYAKFATGHASQWYPPNDSRDQQVEMRFKVDDILQFTTGRTVDISDMFRLGNYRDGHTGPTL